MSNETSVSVPARVECPAGRDPAVRLFILAAMLLAAGLYCFYDAYIKEAYPYVSFSEDINGWLTWAFNYYGPYVFIPPAIIIIILALLYLRRVMVADAEGIGYRGKAKTPWSDVQSLDASRLESKGILVLNCAGGKRIKLDSWKLQNFRNIVALVESKVKKVEA